jgi:hypothetical protein
VAIKDGATLKGIQDFFVKRPAAMQVSQPATSRLACALPFFNNALFAFDCITSLLNLHLQEPWPKRNLAGVHQKLFNEEIQRESINVIPSETHEVFQIISGYH